MRRFQRADSVVVIGPSGARTQAWVANRRLARLLGLAFIERPDRGLLLPDCRSIHTFGMQTAIDVVFVTGARVVALRKGLGPGRLAGARAASATLELPVGGARRLGLAPGVEIRFASPAPPAPPSAPRCPARCGPPRAA